MHGDGFILVIEGDERHTPEELAEAGRQLRQDLLDVDAVQVSGVPDDGGGEGTRSALADLPGMLFVLTLAGRMAVPAIRGLAKTINETSRHVRDASVEVKQAGEHLAEARANLGDAAKLVAPKLAERIRNWARRHPDKRVTARFAGHDDVDLTALSTEETSAALTEGLAAKPETS